MSLVSEVTPTPTNPGKLVPLAGGGWSFTGAMLDISASETQITLVLPLQSPIPSVGETVALSGFDALTGDFAAIPAGDYVIGAAGEVGGALALVLAQSDPATWSGIGTDGAMGSGTVTYGVAAEAVGALVSATPAVPGDVDPLVSAAAGNPSNPGKLVAVGTSVRKGLRITGTLTANGTAPVTFPDLWEDGLANGRPYFEVDPSSTHFCQWFSGKWSLVTSDPESCSWESTDDVARPEQVSTWTPVGPATGTPTVIPISDLPAPGSLID